MARSLCRHDSSIAIPDGMHVCDISICSPLSLCPTILQSAMGSRSAGMIPKRACSTSSATWCTSIRHSRANSTAVRLCTKGCSSYTQGSRDVDEVHITRHASPETYHERMEAQGYDVRQLRAGDQRVPPDTLLHQRHFGRDLQSCGLQAIVNKAAHGGTIENHPLLRRCSSPRRRRRLGETPAHGGGTHYPRARREPG